MVTSRSSESLSHELLNSSGFVLVAPVVRLQKSADPLVVIIELSTLGMLLALEKVSHLQSLCTEGHRLFLIGNWGRLAVLDAQDCSCRG
jgi:hypothetical protein